MCLHDYLISTRSLIFLIYSNTLQLAAWRLIPVKDIREPTMDAKAHAEGRSRTCSLPEGREAARIGGGSPGRGPGPQAPGQAGGSDRVADGEGQAEP